MLRFYFDFGYGRNKEVVNRPHVTIQISIKIWSFGAPKN